MCPFPIRCLLLCVLSATSFIASAFDLVPGQIYTTNDDDNVVTRHSPQGAVIDTFTFPAGYGYSVRGLAFDSDGLLYAVIASSPGFNVVRVNRQGAVEALGSATNYLGGNSNYGKLVVLAGGAQPDVIVAAASQLVRFSSAGNQVLLDGNQVHDVELLPTGNLLVLLGYEIREITRDGTFVRQLQPSVSIAGARALAYHPPSGKVYFAMYGYSPIYSRLIRMDAQTCNVEVDIPHHVGTDLTLVWDQPDESDRLLVGNIYANAMQFNTGLDLPGELDSSPRSFVALFSQNLLNDSFE